MLADMLLPVEEVVSIGTGQIKAHALTMRDFANLQREYGNVIASFFSEKPENFFKWPEIVETVIAIAIKEDRKCVEILPVGVQIQLLEVIWRISGVKEDVLGELVLRMLTIMKKISEKITFSHT